MYDIASVASSPFASLATRFGDRLSVRRDAGRASWTLEGRTATVVPGPDGFVEATFTDLPTADGYSAEAVVAVYRPAGRRYALASGDCARLVDDMIAFFSGVREPRFAFARIDRS